MFAKYWEPGLVKTRLAAAIGDLAASQIYLLFIRLLTARLADSADSSTLAYWPPDRRQAFASLVGENWDLVPQSDGQLGKRMQDFFATAFEQGAQQVVLIGSDSPTIPHDYVRESFRLLDHHRVVLGPANDGGYYLVGMAEYLPAVFDRIRWSTSSVWQDTLRRISEFGLTYSELPPWYDVDEPRDLVRLRNELAELSLEDADWMPLLAAIDAAL